ncbi:MAG: DNA translocase FtsK [Candidatus Paceibacterota bacterium]
MGKKKRKNNHNPDLKEEILPEKVKGWIMGVLMIVASLLITLGFFEKAGIAGTTMVRLGRNLIGETIFVTPVIFFLAGFVFFVSKYPLKIKRQLFYPIIIASLFLILGITGLLGCLDQETKQGGYVGYILSWPFLRYFGFWASVVIFLSFVVIGGIIFGHFIKPFSKKKEEETIEEKPSIFRRMFEPKFDIKEVPDAVQTTVAPKIEEKTISSKKDSVQGKVFPYNPPPIDLLDIGKEVPTSGDIKTNITVIKRTLQNFGIDVMMSEVNTGPTVTQYTLKPAEGIKLSKITGLSNDLALSLASHPIRIEAPIPGRSLVGIEVPNKIRANVRLRDLIENSKFKELPMNLTIALGKDVSGVPIYVDLTRMPHLLVAGSTGTGKTIFLNSLIANLLYQESTASKSAGPDNLRFIMVDPKRVEFSVYSNLPHLLCPIIYNASQTINALKWLTKEMERRFEVLSEAGSRNIVGYNEKSLKKGKPTLPFIVLIIDELADLMAAKGKEIEALVARLAQMARAVGIHIVLATQRPSVEVITGLIKANITSRITFQVASQVDSRTVIDTAGAEKLIGFGDMLYVSAEFGKPKRIQGPYVSEKEVKKVVDYIISKEKDTSRMDEGLIEEIEKTNQNNEDGESYYKEGDDSLYEEAKKIVIESKKASASLLQRRLKIGYARAARLIDMLEERGVVGPADGAKAREVYTGHEESDNWEKI